MASEDRFKPTVIANLAKRAANRCSNPDCGAITSGPAGDRARSVNVGEAAHIYGANPGSARFDAAMVSADRSDITNAIWLCGNCHKLIDDDPTKYPAGLLFEWQRDHEQRIAAQVGKAGAELRQRYERRHLQDFGKLSYLAERIIIEKGPAWEYKLTSEMLRVEVGPVIRRWTALRRGLYMFPTARVAKRDAIEWLQDRFRETGQIVAALSDLLNVEFARAWGEPGVPGDDTMIVETCRLFAEVCKSALVWEETVRFTTVDSIFEENRSLLEGVIGLTIDEVAKISLFLANIFENDRPEGEHKLSLVFNLPEGWGDAYAEATRRAEIAYLADIRENGM